MDTNNENVTSEKIIRDGQEWIDGRSLYAALGLDGKFRDWIKRRISLLSLCEDTDYIASPRSTYGNSKPGGPAKEYLLNPYAADRIVSLEKAKAVKPGRRRRIESYGKLDEYGLPIRPSRPPKHGRTFINPYDLT